MMMMNQMLVSLQLVFSSARYGPVGFDLFQHLFARTTRCRSAATWRLNWDLFHWYQWISMVVLMQKMAIQSPEKCGKLEVFSIKTLSLYRESGFRLNIMEYGLKMLHSLSTGLGGISQTWRVLQFIALSWWEWNTLGKIVFFICWAISEVWWRLPIWQVFWVSGSFTMFRNILPLTNPRCHHDCHCLLQTRHDSHRSRVNDFRKRCTKRAGLRRQKVMGVTLKMGITDANFTI